MPNKPPLHYYPSRVRNQSQVAADKVASTKRYNDQRPATDSFYGTAQWQRVRRWQLGGHPLCNWCLEFGLVTPASVVDHIVPVKRGGAPLDAANLQSLCHACHNKKTATERMDPLV